MKSLKFPLNLIVFLVVFQLLTCSIVSAKFMSYKEFIKMRSTKPKMGYLGVVTACLKGYNKVGSSNKCIPPFQG